MGVWTHSTSGVPGACILLAPAPNPLVVRWRIMETGLRFLMRDGSMHVQFRPRLTSEQYTELMLIIDRPTTKAELCRELEMLAKQWGTEVQFDE